MSTEIIVALLGLIGTLCGSFGGIIVSSKMTQYRITKLEEKVNKHNNLIERTFKLEEQENILEERLNNSNRRISELEAYHKHA